MISPDEFKDWTFWLLEKQGLWLFIYRARQLQPWLLNYAIFAN